MTNLNLFSWNQLAPPPLPRAGCAVGLLGTELVVAGGTYWREGRKFWSERVDRYDAVTNTWTPMTPLPHLHGDAATLAHDDTLYVFGGGAEGEAGTAVWALRDNTWSALAHLALPAPRRSSGVAVVDGIFYLLGGLCGSGTNFASATSTVWAAAPGGVWEIRASMPGPARFNTSVGVVGGRIVVAGGCTPENGAVRNLDDILAYDPAADRWTSLGRLPLSIRASGALADGSGLLLFGGYTDKFETDVLRLEVPTGHVQCVGRLPVGLAGAHFLRSGSRVLGVTGENGVKMRFPNLIGSP